MTVDTPLYIASAAKLITCVAAARRTQDGLVALVDDLTKVLLELKDLQVIKGYDTDEKVELELHIETLLFQPGKGWVYGHGFEWVGQVVRMQANGIFLRKEFRR
ncbi:hypothetical protein MMC18_007953 [Xylographa bjoerkii]|nr:hypothetical protein [Xylographa bjoerkii]